MSGRLVVLKILLLAWALTWLPAQAEIRKWVDEHGQVHYEETTGESYSSVPSSGPRDEAGEEALRQEQERAQRQKRVLEAMASERRARQQEKEKSDKERREAATRCEQAKQELSRRQSAGYLYRKGKDGEREVFTDEEHAGSIAEAEAAVKKRCK